MGLALSCSGYQSPLMGVEMLQLRIPHHDCGVDTHSQVRCHKQGIQMFQYQRILSIEIPKCDTLFLKYHRCAQPAINQATYNNASVDERARQLRAAKVEEAQIEELSNRQFETLPQPIQEKLNRPTE